jgi:hypothetical protein
MTIWRSTILKTTMGIGCASLLAGCLSSGGSGSSRAVVDQSVVDISSVASPALIAAVNNNPSLSTAEVQAWDSAVTPIATTLFEDDPITPWSNVPSSGTRNYIGGLELVPNGNNADRVFGVLTATADFDTEAIGGIGRDFVRIQDGAEAPGTLTFAAKFFPDNNLTEEFGIRGSLDGDLTGAIQGEVDIDIDGDFADSGSVIYGGGTGTATDGSTVTDLKAALVLSEN